MSGLRDSHRMLTAGCAAIVCSVLVLAAARAHAADVRAPSPRTGELLRLAEPEFPTLTRAERALLEFADIRNHARGDFAFAGTSTVPTDATYDPAHADKWDDQRDVRAELIRWLCVDPDASKVVDPRGIRLLGARITGKLDLSHVHVPFGIALIRCVIPERINLDSAQIPNLDLNASYTGEIFGPSVVVDGDADIGNDAYEYGNPYRAAGEVFLHDARIGGLLSFGEGKFHFSPAPPSADPSQSNSKPAVDLSGAGDEMSKPALDIGRIQVKGTIYMCCEFEAQGAVKVNWATAGALQFGGGHFINPGNVALLVAGTKVDGDVYLAEFPPNHFEADGLVSFVTAVIGGNFVVHAARFKGAAGDKFSLDASGIDVRKAMVWQGVEQNGGFLNLDGATVQYLIDDESSWPRPGNLILDGFTYTRIGPPVDVAARLRWLGLQPPGFHPQPYRQLAKNLRENGDEEGALEVLIAMEDARYVRFGIIGKIEGALLKFTIGYGHRPLLALFWSFMVVLVGWGVVRIGKGAGVMRLTWPETTPPPAGDSTASLHPLLYSLDVFLPFVNLHQEHYWWPDEAATGQCSILGYRLSIHGSALRYYLWLQIIAGWLLSAIFVAGVTGLLRNE